MDYEHILYEQDGGKARITLNRPEKLNALSIRLQRELHDALWQADAAADVHVIILRGAGRAFSAGYDMSPDQPRDEAHAPGAGGRRGGREFDDDTWYLEQSMRLRNAILDVHKPVIAQVHGYCLAGGTDVALLCDIVVASQDAVLGFPPARAMGSLPNQMWVDH